MELVGLTGMREMEGLKGTRELKAMWGVGRVYRDEGG